MAGRLYPPIVDYSMPAFAIEGDDSIARIYFALPVYTSWNEVGSVHVTVRYLDNNENALSLGYQAKIKVAAPRIDDTRVTRSDKYFIELDNSDLYHGFVAGTTYKVQLRLSKLTLAQSGAGPAASWFNENYAYFSEWSTVSLIRPITKPTYSILGLEDAFEGSSVNFTSLDPIFTVQYTQGDSDEPLKSWRGRLYNGTKEQLLADSGTTTFNNYSYLPIDYSDTVAFEMSLPYLMVLGEDYVLQLDITTRNGYESTTDFHFTCYPSAGVSFNGTIEAELIEEEAYALIKVQSAEILSNNLVIRRTSSKSNFIVWEDLAVKAFANESVDWEYHDFTIESGIWYKYGVQIRDIHGHRGVLTQIDDPLMCEFEHAFLLEADGRQLKLKYDFNISTANITVSETKTDTIGSKYPFVRRNGNMYYRTFQCTGLITGYMDADAHLFTDLKEIYNNEQVKYADVRNQVNLYVNQYDYTYERLFREKVQEFLYDDKIKLFKSLQEGNILVKLLNISLTPKNNLGRLLYSFSAQAVEIDEPTLVNLNNYGLQIIGQYEQTITFTDDRLGQLSSYTSTTTCEDFPAKTNLIQKIAEKYGWVYEDGVNVDKTSINGIIVNDFKLTHLRIEFESDPYLIERNGNRLTVFNGKDTTGKDLILGWLFNFDTDTILVQPPNNIYELKIDGLSIDSSSSIYPLKNTQMSVYFSIKLEEELDVQTSPVSTSLYNYNGQVYRTFKPHTLAEDVVTIVSNRYARTDGTDVYELDGLITADIEAEIGTILYARSSVMDEETKFVINETGNLYLDPGIPNTRIDTLHFEGRQIDIRYLDPLYKWDDQYHYNETEAITHFNEKHNNGDSKPATARDYDFYTDASGIHMFFDREWRDCVKVNDFVYEIVCPVTAIVNYYAQQKKGVYQRN